MGNKITATNVAIAGGVTFLFLMIYLITSSETVLGLKILQVIVISIFMGVWTLFAREKGGNMLILSNFVVMCITTHTLVTLLLGFLGGLWQAFIQ